MEIAQKVHFLLYFFYFYPSTQSALEKVKVLLFSTNIVFYTALVSRQQWRDKEETRICFLHTKIFFHNVYCELTNLSFQLCMKINFLAASFLFSTIMPKSLGQKYPNLVGAPGEESKKETLLCLENVNIFFFVRGIYHIWL